MNPQMLEEYKAKRQHWVDQYAAHEASGSIKANKYIYFPVGITLEDMKFFIARIDEFLAANAAATAKKPAA